MKLQSNKLLSILALLACLGVAGYAATLNIRTSHNWGDDFAQYIIQGRNIVEHRPQLATGVIQNEWSALRQIPDAAPVGWPLLLSIAYRFHGNSMYHFGQLVGWCLGIFGLAAVGLYRRSWSWGMVFLLASVLCLSPWLINFKSSILTDIPFTACILLVFYLHECSGRRQWWSTLLMGLLAGYAIAIRPAGAALFASLGIWTVWILWRKQQPMKREILHRGTTLIVGILVSVLLNSVLFSTGIGSSYYGFWAKRAFQTSSTTTFTAKPEAAPTASLVERYATTLVGELQVFRQIVPATGRLSLDIILRNTFLALIALGLLLRLTQPRVTDLFVIVYVGMLVVLQIRPEQGFRYLLPTLPFVLEYFVISLRGAGELMDHLFRRLQARLTKDTV